MSDAPLAAPGWYGKLPSLGDFASRRLDPAFIETWDRWLAHGMLELRERQGATWIDTYLVSPSWRFLLMPGALPGEFGTRAWAGVVMPSVDRVGRYFPFTLVQALDAVPVSTLQMQSLWHWLGRLDELAADALHDDWRVERLEAELSRLAGPPLIAQAMDPAAVDPVPGVMLEVPLEGPFDAAGHIDAEAHALWCRNAIGRAYWFATGEPLSRRLLISRGLPASAAALLGVSS